MKNLTILLLALLFAISCTSTKDAGNQTDTFDTDLKKIKQRDANNRSIDLTERIKRFPGVTVSGSRGSATFTIRNTRSFELGDGQPLFVLDGQLMNSYDQVYSSVDQSEVKKIEVLRKVSETADYGFRGNYGVIRITTDQ